MCYLLCFDNTKLSPTKAAAQGLQSQKKCDCNHTFFSWEIILNAREQKVQREFDLL
jgi:hypothetical protein